MIRKLNSIISLLCCMSLLGHFGTMTRSMLTGWYDFVLCKRLAHMTAYTVSAHVFLILIIFFFLNDGTNLTKYKNSNLRVILQRASGVIIILLVHFHVKNYGFIMSGEPFLAADKVRICAMELIFFASIFIHLATSFSRAFITLGIITDDKKIDRLDIITRIVCIVCFIAVSFVMLRFVITFGV